MTAVVEPTKSGQQSPSRGNRSPRTSEQRPVDGAEAAAEAEGNLGHPHRQLSARVRDLAMFDLAIDSKLRACVRPDQTKGT
jgi:hypothetical protein